MKIFNTYQKKIVEIESENEQISMYVCGPTVYDFAHIGNLRTFLFEDLLRRALIAEGKKVNVVMNITDVDDKTIKRSEGSKADIKQLTEKYEKAFFEDLDKLKIMRPNEVTRATEYIEEMVSMVSDLLEKGYAYRGEDGSIYFSISKFADYGKLSGIDRADLKSGARVSQDEYDKENPADFVLWKAWDEADGEVFWETILGKGRPGWHIECSAMSKSKLGETIDIHAGGVDLIFPHHENEIAQSEASSGKKFVRYWVHGEHLLVDGKKMSKSANNFYKLSDIESRGYSSLDFRYLCVSAHYRSKLNFTWEGIEASKNARERILNLLGQGEASQSEKSKEYKKRFFEAIYNDLDTPSAMAVLWEGLRDLQMDVAEKRDLVFGVDEVLGLDVKNSLDVQQEIPDEIKNLAKEREEARGRGDWNRADEIRNEIKKRGYELEDGGGGTKIVKG